MGTTALNMHERMDGLLYALVHPQKPMVTTRVLDLVHFDQASLVEHATFFFHPVYYLGPTSPAPFLS